MSAFIDLVQQKIHTFETIEATTKRWKAQGNEIVFTNGCFDLLHYGHLHYLAEARDWGDKLIIGVNASASVSRLKGNHRPINDELTRVNMLAALQMVDAVVVFGEDTPLTLIELITPDVLVKGGDWQPKDIIGSDWVLQHGGQVHSLPFIEGYSTTNIEQKIISTHLLTH